MHFRIKLFLLAIVLRSWNPIEYIHKIIISFFTVPLDEINYGVNQIKLCKIQNQPFAGVLQDSFLRISLNSQTNTCVRVSFLIRLQVNLTKFCEHPLYRTPTDDCFWKWKVCNKGNWFSINYFSKLKIYKMAKTTLY